MKSGVKSAFKDFHDLGGIQDAINAQIVPAGPSLAALLPGV